MPAIAPSCPRCQRPLADAGGVCLRCAGERALALDLEPMPPPAPDAAGGSAAAALPARIGPYEIIDELGRGGMARVYAARQPQLDRLVALKVLEDSAATAERAPRFLREANTVARLRHPHIIGLHDFGRAAGCIYLAMDLIEGGDLAARRRAGPLPPVESATLLHKLAQALAYAHDAGVLHRDLKPSNVLLSGSEPVLADFGLAADLAPGGDLTQRSAVLGTLHYLAPEALSGGSGAMTVAADIYGLGAILYELLCGQPPYPASTVVDLASRQAQDGPRPPRQFDPAVPRDLETICLKCLERDPQQRYATAHALAEDLRRFRAGEPILARPPTLGEQVVRLARRHRTLVTLSALCATLLVAGATVAVIQAVRARRAEQRAEAEAQAARALADFVQQDILLQASPTAQPDREVRLRTVLESAAARIEDRFAGQPVVEATVRATLAEALHALGEYAKAAEQWERAARLRNDAGADPVVTWQLQARQALALTALARHADAENLLQQVLGQQRARLGENHADTLTSLQTLARIRQAQDRLADALALRREVATRRAHTLGPDAPLTLEAENFLATTLLDLGQFAEAEVILRRVHATRQRTLGPSAPATLESLNNLAGANWALGQLAAAETLLQDAVRLTQERLGPRHPDTLRTLSNLGHVQRAQRRTAEAAATFAEALDGLEATLGTEHQEVLRTGGTLATVYQQQGRLEEAEALFRRVTDAAGRRLGGQHPEVLTARAQLASVLMARGKFAEAEPILRATYAGQREHDANRPAAYLAQATLGACLTGLQQYPEAEQHLLAAHAGLTQLADRLTPAQKGSRRETATRLAALYRAWQRPELAAEWDARAAPANP